MGCSGPIIDTNDFVSQIIGPLIPLLKRDYNYSFSFG